ncbi:MAG: hypothetical protein OXC48_09495 [Endozoicomonadaceae bacterium]|nr:hypothetical protein [Endozoicomonadaceae bacterium]
MLSITYPKKIHNLLTGLIIFTFWLFVNQNGSSKVVSVYKKSVEEYSDNQPDKNKSALLKQKHPLSTHSSKKNSRNKLFSDESEDASVWSNAFNFNKSWGAEVDPRTGILIVHFKVASLLSNLGHGPDINLQINYNSNNITNPDGIGQGWSWNLTHFNPQLEELTTSGGQAFYLQQQGKYHWRPRYHKLDDIRIDGDKSTHFVITYANGLREILSHDGYILRLEQQDEHYVSFVYKRGTHLLQRIVDEQGHKIIFKRNQGYISVISSGVDGQPVMVRIIEQKNKPDQLILPVHDKQSEIKIHVKYVNNLINQIIYPSGLKKTYLYNCSNAMKRPVLWSSSAMVQCVISEEMVDSGTSQPRTKIHYSYSRVNKNEHNYLGFNSGLAFMPGMQRDTLFEAPVSYLYHTQTDNGLVREIRTYNKYHLLINDKLISDDTNHLLSETENFFCSIKVANGCAQTRFDHLPKTYSLPLKTVIKTWGMTSDTPQTNTMTMSYDDQGRMVSHTDVYGRFTTVRYCPSTGDTACPALQKSWSLRTLPESKTIYPASTEAGIPVSPPVTTWNYYHKQASFNGAGYILVLDHQTLRAGKQWLNKQHHYYNNPSDLLTYGLLKKTVLTGNTAPVDTLHSVVHDYRYTQNFHQSSETIYQAIELDQGKLQRLPAKTISLFTHQVIEKTAAGGKNITRYHYDSLGRLTETDLAAGTVFAARRYYQYRMAADQNAVIVTAANGLQQKITFDNAGRKLKQFREMVSINGQKVPGQWLPEKAFNYDAYGRIIRQIVYLTDTSGKVNALVTKKYYDASGRISHIDLPDKESEIALYDNEDRCTISYRQNRYKKSGTVSAIRMNLLEKPIETRLFPSGSGSLFVLKSLCSTHYNGTNAVKISSVVYDGFGRPVVIKDPAGRVVHKYYDALGRLSDTTDPVGDVIHYVYNLTGQLIQRWALPVSGGHYLLSSADYNAAGQLIWQAGEDGQRKFFTYTQDGHLATVTTPAGHIFTWQYNIAGLPVARYLDGKVLLQSEYDPLTLRVSKKIDITGTTIWKYSDDGLVQQLIHTGNNHYPDYRLSWQYDLNRRIISAADIAGNLTLLQYDKLGRITTSGYKSHKKNSTETISSSVYDDFSRVHEIDYGSGIRRKISYDLWGHSNTITDIQNNGVLFKWKFAYDNNDNIIRIDKQATKHQQSTLTYHYDALDNLIAMTCDGLSLCPRDTTFKEAGPDSAPIIIRQNYNFTPLNRIAHVKEALISSDINHSLTKVMTYDYANAKAPLRLQKISTAWNQKAPESHYLMYDITGNMLIDGEGNKINYNAFNQIVRVLKVNGEQSYYTYDGGGKKVVEKTASGNCYLFYRNNHLINEKMISNTLQTHFVGYQGAAKTLDDLIYAYQEANYKGDVAAILTKNGKQQYRLNQLSIYSPYGMIWHSHPVTSLWQQNLLGFDGQRTDPATGWQFLGSGHRTYNPQQRYFVSEDPAGDGYAFGSNNPIMTTDPSGNLPKWLQTTFKIMRHIGTFGTSTANKMWATILGATAMTLCTLFSLGFALAIKNAYLGIASVLGTAATGSVSIIAGLFPDNKGLNIAASVIGIIQLVVTVGSTAFLTGYCIQCCLITDNLMSAESIEELEMTNVVRPSVSPVIESDSQLTRALKDIVPEFIRKEQEEYYFHLTSRDDVTQLWYALKLKDYHPGNDIGTLFVTAKIAGKPVSVNRLEMLLINERESALYQQTLRSLFKDLTTYEGSPVGLMTDIRTMLPPSTAVVLVNDHYTCVVQRLFGNFNRMGNNIFLKATTLTEGGLPNFATGSFEEIMQPFEDDGEVVLTEYYYI